MNCVNSQDKHTETHTVQSVENTENKAKFHDWTGIWSNFKHKMVAEILNRISYASADWLLGIPNDLPSLSWMKNDFK